MCLRTATCLYTSTEDARFVIDRHPEFPQIVLVSPCSGHGFKHSAAIGEAVTEWVMEGRSRLDLGPFGLRATGGWADGRTGGRADGRSDKMIG